MEENKDAVGAATASGAAIGTNNNNENSAVSFWSSSNSDSDDFNGDDANKADAAADHPTSSRK